METYHDAPGFDIGVARELATKLVESLPQSASVSIPDAGSAQAIARDDVPAIAEMLHMVVAETVASLINAGSERDAVMENADLRRVLEQELYGWAYPEA